ncbi:MAG TPA: hypothetical protein VMS00_13990, partial [Acidimicrobiales bacterium]|nr:hypothetical protein [Acidimicrobiales bacterium]
RFLRVTWHPVSSTLVFSHWTGTVCTASTPVKLPEASKIVDMVVSSLRDVAQVAASPVAPGTPRLLDRLLKRARPPLAAVLRLPQRLATRQPGERSG